LRWLASQGYEFGPTDQIVVAARSAMLPTADAAMAQRSTGFGASEKVVG
jgi:hypothetical protein